MNILVRFFLFGGRPDPRRRRPGRTGHGHLYILQGVHYLPLGLRLLAAGPWLTDQRDASQGSVPAMRHGGDASRDDATRDDANESFRHVPAMRCDAMELLHSGEPM